MVVTLTGPNTFLLQRELGKLVQTFVAEHGELALERIDGEEAELTRLGEAINSLPFLASKKMVVLRRPSANKQFAEQAEQLLQAVPETNDIIIIEPKFDKRSGYYKYLKKSTDYREYNELDSNGLAAWLIRTAKEQGGGISSNDARYLVERVGANQQMLANEITKLILYDQQVSRSTIDVLTDQAPQSTIFQLLEAAFAGKTEQALGLYAEQRALKVEAPQIVAMLAWQLHILALVKAAGDRSPADIAKDAKLSPYVVQKSVNFARTLSLQKLKLLIQDLLSIDSRSKRLSIDSDEALQLYILKMAQ